MNITHNSVSVSGFPSSICLSLAQSVAVTVGSLYSASRFSSLPGRVPGPSESESQVRVTSQSVSVRVECGLTSGRRAEVSEYLLILQNGRCNFFLQVGRLGCDF